MNYNYRLFNLFAHNMLIDKFSQYPYWGIFTFPVKKL